MKIIKRNGETVPFDTTRIYRAIEKAMLETEKGIDSALCANIAHEINTDVMFYETPPHVEEIQDMVEYKLAKYNRYDVARTYALYRENRKKARSQGWEMTELQKDIFKNKYEHNNEKFAGFVDRISNGNDAIRKLIIDKKFLPAGRILAGRGLHKDGRKITVSNCYVLPPVEDNIESIFDTAKEMARTYSWGGYVLLSHQ